MQTNTKNRTHLLPFTNTTVVHGDYTMTWDHPRRNIKISCEINKISQGIWSSDLHPALRHDRTRRRSACKSQKTNIWFQTTYQASSYEVCHIKRIRASHLHPEFKFVCSRRRKTIIASHAAFIGYAQDVNKTKSPSWSRLTPSTQP